MPPGCDIRQVEGDEARAGDQGSRKAWSARFLRSIQLFPFSDPSPIRLILFRNAIRGPVISPLLPGMANEILLARQPLATTNF